MVRTSRPLVERMTLVWHDWFATSNDGVGSQQLMLQQNELFRRHALGSFRDAAARRHARPGDAALAQRASRTRRTRRTRTTAREMMELFTLGAGRGYTERDVREQARALTGWRERLEGRRRRRTNFRFDRDAPRHGHQDDLRQDAATSTGATRAASASSTRATRRSSSRKLWSYFVPTPPTARPRRRSSSSTRAAATRCGRSSRRSCSHPALYTGPRDGQAAGRLHGRAAARARARDRHRRLGLDRRRAPASGSSTRRTSPAGTTRAGSTPRPSAAAGTSPAYALRTTARSTPSKAQAKLPLDAREARSTARSRSGSPVARPSGRSDSAARRSRSARSRDADSDDWKQQPYPVLVVNALRQLIASPPTPDLAERELPPLPATSRARSCSRRAAAEAGRGLPAIEPGMPLPAGTGLTRRSFLARSAGLALAVYGAGCARPAPFEEGIASAATGAGEAGARLDLPRRRRRLALAALPGRRPALPAAAPEARAAAGAGPAVRRGPAPALAPGARAARPARTARARSSSLPGDRLHAPRPVALHLAPLLGGRRDRPAACAPAGSAATSTVSATPDNPLQGLSLDGQLAAGARDRERCRSPRSTGPTATTSGRRGVWGEVEERMLDALAHARRARGAPTRRSQAASAVDAWQSHRLRTAAAAVRRRQGVHEPGRRTRQSTTRSRSGWPGSRRCSPPGLPLRCVALSAPGAYDTHADQAGDLAEGLELTADVAARLPARPRGARARRPRARRTSGRSSGGAREENGSAGTDHGAAGIGFLIGTRAAGGDGRRVPGPGGTASTRTATCAPTSDFRGVYCALLEQWLGVDAERDPRREPSRGRSSCARRRPPVSAAGRSRRAPRIPPGARLLAGERMFA